LGRFNASARVSVQARTDRVLDVDVSAGADPQRLAAGAAARGD
jgi:hypothetical protein